MTPWQAWCSAWLGLDSAACVAEHTLPEAGADLLSLGLLLEGLVDAGALRQARWLGRDPTQRAFLLLLLARLRQGCPESEAAQLDPLVRPTPDPDDPRGIDMAALRAAQEAAFPALRRELSDLRTRLEVDPSALAPLSGSPGGDPRPLLCVGRGPAGARFAFARQEAALERIAADLAARRARSRRGLAPERIDSLLARLGSVDGIRLHEGQVEAVRKALEERLVVLTGGPGTGKTTVVTCLLWLLLESDPSLDGGSVVLCAPTGRAQARLGQSLRAGLERIPACGPAGDPRLASLRGARTATLHSLLGARPDGSFRHHRDLPVPCRVAVVDEASMVDLALFSALLEALPEDAHLVLVGDPDQLPSVDPGAVLADLVQAPSLVRHHAPLSHTWRNAGDIARCARAVRSGTFPGIPSAPGRTCADPIETGSVVHLDGALEDVLGAWTAAWISELGSGVTDRRVLCVVHGGPRGREAVNRFCDARLREATGSRGAWVPGQPVLLTRSHPDLGLWNGDLGLVVERGGRVAIDFPDAGMLLEPSRLEGLESAWAITVHKSQGSEFRHVLLVLPERDGALLSRPILYTALTRARETARILGDPALLAASAARLDERPSRLREI